VPGPGAGATTPAQLCDELGLGPVAKAVDVIVGGPPCQAFARVGRAMD
jgi:DNA (cytosine-5)-methyltransferase 1